MPSASCVSIVHLRFQAAATWRLLLRTRVQARAKQVFHPFVTRLHIHKLSLDKKWYTSILWKIKSPLPYILKCVPAHSLKNTLTSYTNSDISTKIIVLLPVDWDKNGLLIIKRLHMMNKIIGYSYVKTKINSIELYGIHQSYTYMFIYMINLRCWTRDTEC